MPKSFLIVEDHPIFRDALELALKSGLRRSSVTTAGGLAEAKAILAGTSIIDLALLDLWLPDTDGYQGLIELRRLHPKLPVVVMSAFSDPIVVEKAMLLGASGFIPKSADRETIVRFVTDVLAGDVCLPSTCTAPLAGEADAALRARVGSLTEKQMRVLDLMRQGRLNKEIAYMLDVGETTVKAHVGEILRKLSVNNRTQAVIEVSRLDLHAVGALYTR